ncbi:uncharacterized protein LOC125869731 [Solanum stenotomum]|uniref:uncharacterized protein LOC125869731 n=1 Tax=Solanum stenotomum TaxID=172797 RepID=UPI0020D0CD6C|nr:uncharacterized protein LOC125869731 [Solanum stenotomum]
MIKSAIHSALTPLQTSIDTLTTRVEVCECRHGETSEITTLKAEVADLRKDVDYLKFTDFTSLLKATDDLDALKTSKIPPATTGDVHRDDVAVNKLDAETDEEKIEVHDITIYDDLADLEDIMFETERQTYLRDTTMGGPSESFIPSKVTAGTKA